MDTGSKLDALWIFDSPLKSEENFREMLREENTSVDPDTRAEVMTQLARALGLQGRFSEAHEVLGEVEKTMRQEKSPARIHLLLERGRLLNSSGQATQSKNCFRRAWELAREIGEEYLAIDAAHMLGIVETPEKQVRWNEKALEMTQNASDPKSKKWFGPLYNNLGWTYFGMGKYDKALELFQKGVEVRAESAEAEPLRIAKWCVARTLRALGKVDEALQIQRRLKEEIENTRAEPDGFVFEELGECLLEQGKKEAARPHLRRALELLSKDKSIKEHEPERLKRLEELSGTTSLA